MEEAAIVLFGGKLDSELGGVTVVLVDSCLGDGVIFLGIQSGPSGVCGPSSGVTPDLEGAIFLGKLSGTDTGPCDFCHNKVFV